MRKKISGKEAVIALLNDRTVFVEDQSLRWKSGLLSQEFSDNTIAGRPTAYLGTDWTMERIAVLKECEVEVDDPEQTIGKRNRQRISGQEAKSILLGHGSIWRGRSRYFMLDGEIRVIRGESNLLRADDGLEEIASRTDCEIEVDESEQVDRIRERIAKIAPVMQVAGEAMGTAHAEGLRQYTERFYVDRAKESMSAKDALRWLIDHEGEELEDSEGKWCFSYRPKWDRGIFGLCRRLKHGAAGTLTEVNLAWFLTRPENCSLSRMSEKTARKFPDLPHGYQWRVLDANEPPHLSTGPCGVDLGCIYDQDDRAAYVALIQEFDERTKR
jgi:hypothetical protein